MNDATTTPSSAAAAEQRLLLAVERLERRLDRIEATLGRVDALARDAPKVLATLADTADGLIERAGAAGIDVDERLRILGAVAERLTSPPALASVREVLAHVDVLHTMLTSGVLAEAPVAVVSKAAIALADTCADTPPPLGPWAALRAMRDEGVQRALGFALRFAKRFGESLAPSDPSRRLPPSRAA